MKTNEGIIIGIVVVVLLCVIIFAVQHNNKTEDLSNNAVQGEAQQDEQFVQTTEDGIKVNTSEKFAEKKEVNGIEFTNIQFTESGGETSLIATVTNTGSAKTEMFAVDITLLDENGTEIKTIPGLIAPLEAGASTQFSASTTLDYANAYDFKVTAK